MKYEVSSPPIMWYNIKVIIFNLTKIHYNVIDLTPSSIIFVVVIKLPKLKSVNDKKQEMPKIKLPKLKKTK